MKEKVTERVVSLGGDSVRIGIVTEPEGGISRRGGHGVVLLNSGAVHRVGPHRMSVRIARRLSASGIPVVRFDFSGIGDSGPRSDHMPLRQAMPIETEEAISFLESTYGVRSVVLVGNCSGAAASFRTAIVDPRVTGAVLINPEVHDAGTDVVNVANERSLGDYYVKGAARDPKRWARLLTGRSSYRKIAKSIWHRVADRRAADEALESLSAGLVGEIEYLRARGCQLLFLLSRGDLGEEALRVLVEKRRPELTTTSPCTRHVIEKADHLFTTKRAQDELLAKIESWMDRFSATNRGAAA